MGRLLLIAQRVGEIQAKLTALAAAATWTPQHTDGAQAAFAELLAAEGHDYQGWANFAFPDSRGGPWQLPRGGCTRGRAGRLTPAEVQPFVEAAARKYGLPPALIHAVIKAESDYAPRCVSRAGAMGLMQLMPETARALGVTDPFDPAQNIDAGCRELKGYLERFKRLDLALAAYNAGPGAVRKYGGIPPFPETRAYVRRVLRLFKSTRAQQPQGAGEPRPQSEQAPSQWKGQGSEVAEAPGGREPLASGPVEAPGRAVPEGQTSQQLRKSNAAAGANDAAAVEHRGSSAASEPAGALAARARLGGRVISAAAASLPSSNSDDAAAVRVSLPPEAEVSVQVAGRAVERPPGLPTGGNAATRSERGPATSSTTEGGPPAFEEATPWPTPRGRDPAGVRGGSGATQAAVAPPHQPSRPDSEEGGAVRPGQAVLEGVKPQTGIRQAGVRQADGWTTGSPAGPDSRAGAKEQRHAAAPQARSLERTFGASGGPTEADTDRQQGPAMGGERGSLAEGPRHGAEIKQAPEGLRGVERRGRGRGREEVSAGAAASSHGQGGQLQATGGRGEEARGTVRATRHQAADLVHRLAVRVEAEGGPVTVVASSHGDAVYAHVKVSDPAQGQQLQRAYPALRATLQSEQVNLAALGISLGGQELGGGHGWQGGYEAPAPPATTVGHMQKPPATESHRPTVAPGPQGLLHIYA